MSEIQLKDHPELCKYFSNMQSVPSGICSIQLTPETSPWIICPHRLLYMGNKASHKSLLGPTQKKLLSKCQFSSKSKIGIWAEVKVKYLGENGTDDNASFDYTFDYILCEIGRTSLKAASTMTGIPAQELYRKMTNAGYTLASVNEEITIEDFPIGAPHIIEVMTSSTSGGNKKIRSCIPQAFEDSILNKDHIAPGINYRQVWARMASQLIVKSQAAMAWEGHTIWILQDLLADYISSTTALDLKRFVSEYLSEVNILSFSYADKFHNPKRSRVIELTDSILFAGPIRPLYGENEIPPSFQDIVLASVCPPKSILYAALSKKPISNIIRL